MFVQSANMQKLKKFHVLLFEISLFSKKIIMYVSKLNLKYFSLFICVYRKQEEHFFLHKWNCASYLFGK